MKLPKMRYTSGIKKARQVKFAGLDHTLGGGEGSLWDMKNLTGDHFPVLATRKKRRIHEAVSRPMGLFAAGAAVADGDSEKKLCYVAGDHFYYDGADKGTLRESCNGKPRHFAYLQGKVVIFPDKKYYDVREDAMGDMGAAWSGKNLQFQNGTYGGAPADANTLYYKGANWGASFRKGDGVTIEGCIVHPENNKTFVIQEIDGDYLRFYENAFVLSGEEGTVNYTETGTVTVSRKIPDLVCACAHDNRLWGADHTTIYASALGDALNWNNLDGEMYGWQWEPGSSGNFTACISYRGYPVFFKEDIIYKIYGSVPSNYQAVDNATLGVADGGGHSLAVAGETLFYLGRNGVTAYQGGIPQLIGKEMGNEQFVAGAAGSDGMRYYVSLQNEAGQWRLYVYDTQNGLWNIEDDTQAIGFARCDGELYCLDARGNLWSTGTVAGRAPEGNEEENVSWWAEFGDIMENEPNKKGISSLQIRLELDADATAQVWIQYDSCGQWQSVGKELKAEKKRSFVLPVIPRRCDHYRLKLEGKGQCYIHSIAREFYVGSQI